LIGLRAWQKILGQVAAACVAYWAGVHVMVVAGFTLDGLWSFPLTVVWLVACSNAFNLIDGVDGLATGVGLFATFTILGAALVHGFSHRQVTLLMYAACAVAAAFSLVQTMPTNKFHGFLLVVFCAAVWVGIQFVGYAEFDAASSLVMSGAFRDIVNARLFVDGFERRLGAARTSDDYWDAMRDVSVEFQFPHVRMLMAGTVYEHHKDGANVDHCCVMRIPLFGAGYVNFNFPTASSVGPSIA